MTIEIAVANAWVMCYGLCSCIGFASGLFFWLRVLK